VVKSEGALRLPNLGTKELLLLEVGALPDAEAPTPADEAGVGAGAKASATVVEGAAQLLDVEMVGVHRGAHGERDGSVHTLCGQSAAQRQRRQRR
jgi:hypothetical protein